MSLLFIIFINLRINYDVIGYTIFIKDVDRFKKEKCELVFGDISGKLYYCDIINRKTTMQRRLR